MSSLLSALAPIAAVRAVSFDFDNTLLLSEHLKHEAIHDVAAQFESGAELLKTIHTDSRTAPEGVLVTRHTIFKSLAEKLVRAGQLDGDADTLGAQLCDRFTSTLEQRLVRADEVPGALALLRHLREHEVPCYVNTATPQEPIDKLVDALGWRVYFRRVLGAPATKAANLQAIAEDAGGLEPRQLLHVGDGANDHRAASEFGCPFVGVHLPGKEHATFEHAEAIVGDMRGAAEVLSRLIPSLPPLEERAEPALPALPPPSGEGAAPTATLDVSSGQSVALDHLGPVVVNRDGSISRIGNWDQMTTAEQETTKRRITQRNVERLKALKEQGVGVDGVSVSALADVVDTD